MSGEFTEGERERIRGFDARRDKRAGRLAKAFIIIAALLLTLGLFVLVSESIALNSSVHQKAFNTINLTAQDISSNPKEQSDPIIIDHHIMEYFGNRDDVINVNYFTYDEKAHLRDVKHLVRGFYAFAYVSLLLTIILLILAYIYMRRAGKSDKAFLKNALRVFQIGSGSAAGIWVFLALFFLIGLKRFTGAFMGFHKIFFPEGNYSFPASALIVKVYTEKFFYDVTMLTIKYSMLIFLVVFAITTLLIIFLNQQKRKSSSENF